VGRGDTLRSHATVTLRIYTRLPDGTSVGPGDTQLTLRYLPGMFLPGVEQGIRGMRVGGLRQLVLPPSLGYAATHGPEIPSKTPLVVVVELLSVL
jgi:peptidylprolyl isomerase